MEFKLEPSAKNDIQKEINYYNAKQTGLGKKFHTEIKQCFKTIKRNPFFQIRYKGVRCLPLKKFPVMIHYTVEEDLRIITVRAVINTFRDPNEFWMK